MLAKLSGEKEQNQKQKELFKIKMFHCFALLRLCSALQNFAWDRFIVTLLSTMKQSNNVAMIIVVFLQQELCPCLLQQTLTLLLYRLEKTYGQFFSPMLLD